MQAERPSHRVSGDVHGGLQPASGGFTAARFTTAHGALCRHAFPVLVPPNGQRHHRGAEPAGLARQLVFDAGRHFRKHRPRDQSVRLEIPQLCGQHVLGDAWDRLAQFPEAMNPGIEPPHDFQLPLARGKRECAPHLLLHAGFYVDNSLLFHTNYQQFILLEHINIGRYIAVEGLDLHTEFH